jgi:peptide/nickel transport system permease protein
VRWVIVKLINLIIVLVIVTMVVAAIFTGPLAERERNMIRQQVQQEAVFKKKSDPSLNITEYVERVYRLRIHQEGLDRPWYILTLKYTKMLLEFKSLNATTLTTLWWPTQGDRNAMHIILERLPYSVLLFTTSSILTLLLAMPLALYAARRPGSALDSVIIGWSVFSVSMPWWWLAMVFIYLFSLKTHIFPMTYEVQRQGINWRDPVTVAKLGALPVFTVTLLSIGDSAFRLRNIFLDIFTEDFVNVARAKGLPENVVLRKHVMRAAAPPVVTIVLFSIVLSVFSGAIITELIFNWPGLGRLYWDAISHNDVPVILELTYITTLLYLALRFILDILYTLLDPRIRRA